MVKNFKATACATPNIALIKYWGTRDDSLVLPTNNSIAFSMDESLLTTTTVEFSEKFKEDSLYLNGKNAVPEETERAGKMLSIVREMAKLNLHARIDSKNSFPKSAGLASSASAFAALAGASSKAAGLNLDLRELSMLARRGSGSATRSVFSGAVEWQAGEKKDGSDSYAVQLSTPENWTELRNIVAITSSKEKKVGSARGMKITHKTSSLYSARVNGVKERLQIVKKAIAEKNFGAMAQTIMRESDNMHAVMLDSWPPLTYLNSTSFTIMHSIIELNTAHGEPIAAYTFDAGPNAHIFTTKNRESQIKKLLSEIDGVESVVTCKIGGGLKFIS